MDELVNVVIVPPFKFTVPLLFDIVAFFISDNVLLVPDIVKVALLLTVPLLIFPFVIFVIDVVPVVLLNVIL